MRKDWNAMRKNDELACPVGASRCESMSTCAAGVIFRELFGKLKEFKLITMHSDKTDSGFSTAIYLAAAVINSR